MARKDSEHQRKSMSMLFRGRAIFKPLNTGWIDEHVACVREWIANIFFYRKDGMTILKSFARETSSNTGTRWNLDSSLP